MLYEHKNKCSHGLGADDAAYQENYFALVIWRLKLVEQIERVVFSADLSIFLENDEYPDFYE